MAAELLEPPVRLLSTSLRVKRAEDSLALAESVAMSRGVSRVVDTTWLDIIGIPVYSSIRPDARRNSLCVHAGKGFSPNEAKIGAYMEAIEYSFSPDGRSPVAWQLARPGDILSSFQGQLSFTAFCPRVSTRVTAEEAIAVVSATEICSQLGSVLVPAELVYYPFSANPGRQLYGTSTNGLASGNTVDEATVHALAEVMERDVNSFGVMGASSALVHPRSLPSKALEMLRRIEAAGLQCHVRFLANEFGLPYFEAHVVEPNREAYDPLGVVTGFGLHCNRDIAVVRAIAEAVQGRVTIIHGGRDDLLSHQSYAEKAGAKAAAEHMRRSMRAIADDERAVSFECLPSFEVRSLDAALQVLHGALRRAGLFHVARVVYTEPDFPFQVVRIIVPGAEFFENGMRRVGPRLLRFTNQLSSGGQEGRLQ